VVCVAVLATLLNASPVAAAGPTWAEGEWSDVADWPFIAAHASVSTDGKILTYGAMGGDDPSADMMIDVWDPSKGLGADSHQTSVHQLGIDLFCSFLLSSPDGEGTLLIGGTISGARGLPNFAARFMDGQLTDFPEMHFPRWYGTGTTLPDGRILMQGGVPLADDNENAIDTAEVYSEGKGWTKLTGTTPSGIWDDLGWWYPKSYVTPAGKVWNLGHHQEMFYVDPDGVGAVERLGRYDEPSIVGRVASAVNYAPGMVLHVGGHKATIFDLNYDPPRITDAATMHKNRLFANAVVLPDGRVLVHGGSAEFNDNVGVAYAPEIWDPATNTWTLLAASQTPRLYHSTLLLLPDGRIFSGGGGAEGPQDHLNAEVFTPPYLFAKTGKLAARPQLSGAPKSIEYGQSFSINTTGKVDRVTMIRSGTNTHGMNTQAFVELEFSQAGGVLAIEAPSHATVATPGDYMIFALNAAGVPSESPIVQLSGEGATPPAATPNPDPAGFVHPWTGPAPGQQPVITPTDPKVPPATDPRDLVVECGGLEATIIGTPGNDTLTGTSGADVIAGLQGDDVITGLGGDDIICGGRGNDVLIGGQGFDQLFGAQGNDRLFAVSTSSDIDSQGARMFGGAGADYMVGSTRWDRMQGGKGNDTLDGHKGRDWLRGGVGHDKLDGGGGVDDVHGGAGRDTIQAGPGDKVRGGIGVDTCENAGTAASAWSCEQSD